MEPGAAARWFAAATIIGHVGGGGRSTLAGAALIAPALEHGSVVLVGALAGFYPSAPAARVSPTDALRGT